MASAEQPLTQWVAQLNDTLFIQPNDEVALKAVSDQVDPSFVTKYARPVQQALAFDSYLVAIRINHNVYKYEQFNQGLQYARSSFTSIQDTFSDILAWEDPEKGDGVVAVLSKWRAKDKATGKETKKSTVIIWEVRMIDGKRKLTGQTEVETGGS